MRDTVTTTQTWDPARLAGAIALVSAATVATVWLLQARGYNPCELCLKERIPFYVAIPPAVLLALPGSGIPGFISRAGFALLALTFAAGAVLGAYHAGVEWHLWAGPTGCSGAAAAPADVGDFLKQLDSVTVVRCDEAALLVLGLSLAAWNALLCAALAGLSLLACGAPESPARRRASRPAGGEAEILARRNPSATAAFPSRGGVDPAGPGNAP